MRRAFTLAWSLSLAVSSACNRAPAPATLASSSASSSSAAPSSAAPNRDFPPDEQELDEASALVLGPLPAGVASGDRAEHLRGLLRGQMPVARLPLVETDQGVAFSPRLYSNLTTEVVGGRGLGNIGNGTATLSPPVVVSGKLDASLLERHARQMRGQFRDCYDRALLDDLKLKGKVSLLFVLDGQGAVSSVAVESAPPGSGSLQSCLKARGLAHQFPSLAEGSQGKFRLQIAFKRAEP